MKRLFKQFSFPGGIPSHVAPETPGSIHEGGELGYALSHAYGAAFDNPDLIVACVVGDGEAETGPAATGWHSNKFLNPKTDGAVLPILHLNGYKIANPTVLARIPHDELDQLMRGYGYAPRYVEGDDPMTMHALMAATLEQAIADIDAIQQAARNGETSARPAWPMIVLRSPKGWTCPKEIDGKRTRGLLALAPGADGRNARESRARPHPRAMDEELPAGRAVRRRRAPQARDRRARAQGDAADERQPARQWRRAAARPAPARFPRLRRATPTPGAANAEATREMGRFLAEVMRLNLDQRNFRLFSPDETNSNRWQDVLSVTNRAWDAETLPYDDHLAPDGRVMEMLSEHQCQGWLEGYLLTGRHGFFSCYEAFIHIIDSMFNQHAKWLKVCNDIEWRRPIASLNYLLSSHVWRQDHNGFSHQDPGFIDHVVNKKAEVVRVYLPPDANCLLSVTDHCLRSRNYVNVVVAGKQPAPVWLTMDQAIKHCTAGLGIWEWASNDKGGEPDVVMACCGDVPTLETLAAVDFLRKRLPEVKIRVINVVDLMKLQPTSEHPHGLSDADFDSLFTTDKPVIFAFHGYPWLIHRLTYRRHGHAQSARARLQGGRDDDDAVRHVRDERHRPLPSGQRRHRPRARPRRALRLHQAGDPRRAGRSPRVHPRPRRRHAGDQALGVGRGQGRGARGLDRSRQRLTEKIAAARGGPAARPPRSEDERDEHLRRLHVGGVGRAERRERILLFRFGGQVDRYDDDRVPPTEIGEYERSQKKYEDRHAAPPPGAAPPRRREDGFAALRR